VLFTVHVTSRACFPKVGRPDHNCRKQAFACRGEGELVQRLRACEIEARDRQGYRKRPDTAADVAAWEHVASWPER
jgi:hypothetical protein